MSPPLIDLLLRAGWVTGIVVMFAILVHDRIKHPPKNGVAKEWEDVYDPKSGTGDRRGKSGPGSL